MPISFSRHAVPRSLMIAVFAATLLPFLTLSARALSIGDVIKVDLSSTTEQTGILYDWNLMQNNMTIPTGSVVLHQTASVAAGVSITTNGSGANMDPNTFNWPGFPNDPYYTSNTEAGLVYSVDGGLGITGNNYELNITFSGLDAGLLYNVRVYRLIDEGLANFDVGVTNGSTTDINTDINRAQVFSETTLDPRLIFSGVQTDSSGNLIVSIGSSEATGGEAIVIEVVPEPSTTLLILLGAGFFAFYQARRQRRSLPL